MARNVLLARIGQALLVLWVAYTAAFLLLSALPGDGIMVKFESPEAGLTDEQVALIRDYYHVDSPLLIQYVHAVLGALHGDLGYSIANAMPVSDRIAAALPQTLQLASTGFALAVVLAALITAASAFAPFAGLRRIIESAPSLFISVPTFWLGLLLIQLFSFRWNLVPMIGASPLQALILPAITLSVPISAPLAQVFLRSLDDVNHSPFVQVVHAKGASRWWTLSRHTAKNALLPTLTIAGLLLGELIGGAVITETVYGRNGLGRLVNDSVARQDLPVIQAVVLIAALVFVAVNLAVDLLYPVLDPRLRTGRRTRAVAAAEPEPQLEEVSA
jgi:peptide/nickel transport system permease protein